MRLLFGAGKDLRAFHDVSKWMWKADPERVALNVAIVRNREFVASVDRLFARPGFARWNGEEPITRALDSVRQIARNEGTRMEEWAAVLPEQASVQDFTTAFARRYRNGAVRAPEWSGRIRDEGTYQRLMPNLIRDVEAELRLHF